MAGGVQSFVTDNSFPVAQVLQDLPWVRLDVGVVPRTQLHNRALTRARCEGWSLMPSHPLISIPLDIPDIRVPSTELTKEREPILTVESTLTSNEDAGLEIKA